MSWGCLPCLFQTAMRGQNLEITWSTLKADSLYIVNHVRVVRSISTWYKSFRVPLTCLEHGSGELCHANASPHHSVLSHWTFSCFFFCWVKVLNFPFRGLKKVLKVIKFAVKKCADTLHQCWLVDLKSLFTKCSSHLQTSSAKVSDCFITSLQLRNQQCQWENVISAILYWKYEDYKWRGVVSQALV